MLLKFLGDQQSGKWGELPGDLISVLKIRGKIRKFSKVFEKVREFLIFSFKIEALFSVILD